MSAVSSRTSTRVRTAARSTVFVAAEINSTLLKITSAYGIKAGCLVEKPDVVPRGLMVWLAAKQLKAVVLEILNDKGQLARKFELEIDYSTANDADEIFETQLASLDEFLKTDSPGAVRNYRIICDMTTDNFIPVPGWVDAQFADDKHLHRHSLSSDSISTKDLKVGFAVYTGQSSPPGAKR